MHFRVAILRLALVVPLAGFLAGAQATARTQRPVVRVIYPPVGAAIAASDSNFVLGSVTPANARLSIDGRVVKLHTNGAFLAWLPVPQRGTSAYDVIAVAGVDTTRLSHAVVLPAERPVLASTGPLVIDSGSVQPRQAVMLRGDELVRVSVRAPVNADVFVSINGVRRSLVNYSELPRSSFGALAQDTMSALPFAGDSLRWATLIPARQLVAGARLTVARGSDTVVLPLSRVAIVDPSAPLYGMLTSAAQQVPDSDRFVIARPSPGGTYKWMLLPGTVLEVTGRDGNFVRVRFDANLEAWVLADEVQIMPPGYAPLRGNAGNSRLSPHRDGVDLNVPMNARVPYFVETFDDRLEVTLFGVSVNLDNVIHQTADTIVRSVTTVQESSDRARIVLRTSRRPFGYLVLWQDGSLVLRVRRPPVVAVATPLRGLIIAVDAGHPPAGATGPTGFYEGNATLQIARRLKTLLEARGATVLMTRTTENPLDLATRPVMARRGNAHALVSIHLNASPDGINPLQAHGTSTYYFQPFSSALARSVQSQMVRRLRLRDLGVMYNTFAVTRPTWMPSVLCEGAFIIVPEQEEASRTPTFQTAYATAVADGLQRYFADLAAAR